MSFDQSGIVGPETEEHGPAPDVRISIEYVAPWTATKWLEEYNRRNRRIRSNHLRKLRDAMVENRWLFAGDPIRFDAEGDLLDGQHRLQGVVDSGKGQWFLIIRELDPLIFPLIDTEFAPRTMRDVLDIDGRYELTASGPLAQMAPWLWRWLNNKMDTTLRPEKAQMREALNSCEGVEDSLEAGRLCYKFSPPGMMGALHYIFSTVDPAAATEFVEQLAQAEPDKAAGTLLGELRYRLDKAKEAKSKTYKAPPRVQAAWVIKAFNAYRAGNLVDHASLAWAAVKEPYPVVADG
jgi:hypothetical protein